MKRLCLAIAVVLAACSPSSTPDDGGSGGSGGGGAGGGTAAPDAGQCEPLAVTDSDAGPATPTPATGCARDIDCDAGQFCYAPNERCVTPAQVGDANGAGQGGRAPDGGACEVPSLPATCDATSLDFGPSINVSGEPPSLVESDTVLAADGHGNVLAAWAQVLVPPSTVQQQNRMAVSHDDGKTFTLMTAPTDKATSAANDAVLGYDATAGWTYVWEGYESNFQGAQHVWVSTSQDASTWSTPVQVDAAGDFVTGGALDFPWASRSPINHRLYVTYEVTAANGEAFEKLVVSQPDGGFSPGIEVDDGTRPGIYRDLAAHAFDSAGSLYVAWLELGDQDTPVGGTVGGSLQNAVYVARGDVQADGGMAFARPDVKVSTGTAVSFDGPSIAVTPDGGVYVTWVAGTRNATDVQFAASHDRGQTFSTPVTVNDDAPCATHFHANMVADAKGRPWVIWYDNRDGDGHVFYATSQDEGATFTANRLVSAPRFRFDTFQYSVGWLGDYFQPTIAGGELYVMLSDSRDGDQSHAFFTHATLP